MADIDAREFSIDSTMDVPADGYRATATSSDVFISASESDRITLEAGLRDPSDPLAAAQTVRHIEGNIDEWELTVTPTEITTRIRGRDKIFELLDRQFTKLFLKETPEEGEEPDTDFTVGAFLASEIARDVVEAAGLSLSWQCRDYQLLEDFQATGRAFDILTQLVNPWSQTEQFKVDIFIQGSTVFCRERVENPVPDYTFTAKDTRILRLTIRKRFVKKVGKVTLLGKLEPRGLEETQGFFGAIILSSSELVESTSQQTFKKNGAPDTTIITTRTFRMPDRILLRYTKTVFKATGTAGLELTNEEVTINDFEDSRYTSAGPSNRPRQTFQTKVVSGILKDDPAKTFQELEREEKSYGYDSRGFQDVTTTRKFKKTTPAESIEETERVVKTIEEVENLKTEQTTFTYDVDGESLVLRRIDSQTGAGLKAAGPRPGGTIGGAAGSDSIPQDQIKLEETISTDPRAIVKRFSNRNMDAADLEFIMDLFRRSSGKAEYEIIADYVSMPWLRKGNVLEITGLLSEDEVPIPLAPALIVEQRLRFTEAGRSPQLVSAIRALFWRVS